MNKYIIAAVLVIISAARIYADTARINITGASAYKAVRLTPPIYSSSNADLSDILILDETGRPVPYFFNNYQTIKTTYAVQSRPLIYADSFVRRGATYNDYYAETVADVDIVATSLSLTTNSLMFAKDITLYGGYDGLVWEYVKDDTIYRVDENEKLTINFPRPLKYTYYRIEAANNASRYTDSINISGAALEYSREYAEQVVFTDDIRPAFGVLQDGGDTLIQIHGLKNVRINELSLETADMFKRPVHYASGRSKVLYNLSFGGGAYKDLTLPFGGFAAVWDEMALRIENGDDEPINIIGINVSYYTDEVIFKGEINKTYNLKFADPTITRAPAYDIVNYKDMILQEGYDVLPLGDIIKEEKKQAPPPSFDYNLIFNIVIIAVSALLIVLIVVKLGRKTPD